MPVNDSDWELEHFLADAVDFFGNAGSISAIALVGSHARGMAGPESDVDLMILDDSPQSWLEEQGWTKRFGTVDSASVEDWGRVQSLRVHFSGRPEVEFSFAPPSWAGIPLDSGTAAVLKNGCRILLDNDHLLRNALERMAEEEADPDSR